MVRRYLAAGSAMAKLCCCSAHRAWVETHLAVASGAEAVERGYTVLFNSAVGHLFFQLSCRDATSVLISSNLPVGAAFQKRLKGSAGRIQVERVCY